MDPFPRLGPASKKPRIDAANDETIWGQDDEFTVEDLEQVDLISSQVFSQRPSASTNSMAIGGTTLQRHHSWSASPNENALPKNANLTSKSRSSLLQRNRTGNGSNCNQTPVAVKNRPLTNGSFFKPDLKSWNGSPFGAQKLSETSLQEIERQRQEFKRLQEDKAKCEAQIKQLNEALSRKDFEMQAANSEVDSLKQQSVIKEQRQQEYLLEIKKLKTELEFKRQEHASEQWRASQQQHIRQNNENHVNKKLCIGSTDGSQPRQKIFKSPLKITDDNNCFPSQITFSKRILSKMSEGAPEIAGKSSITPCTTDICLKLNDSVLPLKRPLGMETGPGLVDILLQQANSEQLSEAALVLHNTSLSLDGMTGFSTLLEDDGAIQVKRDSHITLESLELSIFNICLGLRLDCANSMLPSIYKALSSSFGANSDTSVKPGDSSACGSNSPSTKTCSQTDESQNVIYALQMLKQLVYCSPGVCRHLVQEKTEHVQLNTDPQPGTSFASSIQELVYTTKHSFHPIIHKMFEICSLPIHLQSTDTNLPQLALEILGTVATYCPCDKLSRFLPLITPQVLVNCSTLAMGGNAFVELVSLLGTLCSNPNVVETSCNRDDSCFWIPLANAWHKARKRSSHQFMSKLDNLVFASLNSLAYLFKMIQVLSICLTHESEKIPFLSPDEIHCQFEVISSLILYLHHQLELYEESPRLLSIPTLRNGISLLHQVANRDSNFRRHRAQVNSEMFAFLHWLARAKTALKIGPAADLLLEMWNIKEYGSCESKEDFPWMTKSFA